MIDDHVICSISKIKAGATIGPRSDFGPAWFEHNLFNFCSVFHLLSLMLTVQPITPNFRLMLFK